MRTVYNCVVGVCLFVFLFTIFVIKRLLTLIPTSINQASRRVRKYIYRRQDDESRSFGPRFVGPSGEPFRHKRRRRGHRGGKKHRKHFN